MRLRLVYAASLLALAALLVAQSPRRAPLLMADDGTIVAEHRSAHRRKGESVTWGRRTSGRTGWYVRFTDNRTPCQEGAEFGAGGATSCTIVATCDKAGSPDCVYHYRSGLAADQRLHDPDIVIDP